MSTKRLHDVPIKRPGVAINRDDPRGGEGVFVRLVSDKPSELVTANGLTFPNDSDNNGLEPQGNRASNYGKGGYNIVNDPLGPARIFGGNRSGE